MSTQSYRIFVGNLPHEVSRDIVVKKFQKYGIVESVEIKTKNDSSTGQVLATFCYVNLNADKSTLDNCILLLNGIKWGERHLKVEVAKESFLQRLQRERQSASKKITPQQTLSTQPSVDTRPTLNNVKEEKKIHRVNIKSKRDSSSSESSDSESESDMRHPTSKLSMFKGISSLGLSETSPKPEEKLPKAQKVSPPNKGVVQEKEKMFSKQIPASNVSHSNTSSSILKMFETFSDVWKDADEPAYPAESPMLRFNAHRQNVERTRRQQEHVHPAPKGQKSDALIESSLGGTSVAEEKRLKSLDERRHAFEQQKQAVKLALSDKNASRQNKKIVFNDDDNVADHSPVIMKDASSGSRKDQPSSQKDRKRKALSLFDESDDETAADNWTENFSVKKQFEGEKGKKLLELQNKYNNDQRFKLDERFYDDESPNNPSNSEPKSQQSEEGIEGLAEEREQQLQILSRILGKPISVSQPPSQQASKTKGMLRFDPSKPNHLKYELSKEIKESKKKKKSKGPELETKEEEEEEEGEAVNPKVRREEKEPEPVSQNKFYSVSETLAENLRLSKEGQSSGFSLLQMFGTSNSSSESKERETSVTLKRDMFKKPPTLEDSSSDDEADEQEGPTAAISSTASLATTSSTSKIRSVGGVWQESFFFQPDDNRLMEGTEFFTQAADTSDSTKFAKTREALKHIVKKKLRRNTQKNNSFKTKVSSTLKRRAALWPKSSHSAPKNRRKQRK